MHVCGETAGMWRERHLCMCLWKVKQMCVLLGGDSSSRINTREWGYGNATAKDDKRSQC